MTDKEVAALIGLARRPLESASVDRKVARRLLTSWLAEVVNLVVPGATGKFTGDKPPRVAHLRITQAGLDAVSDVLGLGSVDGWRMMGDLATLGPAQHVDLILPDGSIIYRAHFACGDGDGLMPPFGPAWFQEAGASGFVEVDGDPVFWRPA